MKYLICPLLFLMFGINAFSQNYTRDVGLRVGEGIFFTYRQFYSEDYALEGMVGISKEGFRISGLREFFFPLANKRSDNLNIVYGYGIHTGITYTNKYKVLTRVYTHDWMWSPQFGFDGLAGFEYSASELPLLVSACVQPYFEFALNRIFRLKPFNFVVTFKYRF